MFGKLLSSAIKVATLPAVAANAAVDIATGGDGSKRSRCRNDDVPNPFALIEEVGDALADAAKRCDD